MDESISDFERGDQQEMHELFHRRGGRMPRKGSKESEVMKSGSDHLNGTVNSSNILVEPYIASSPDMTTITNPIIEKRLHHTNELLSSESKKRAESEYVSAKKVLTGMDNIRGLHESGEQS